jgi:hypothetical protein
VATRDFLRTQLREMTEEVVARSRSTEAGDADVGADLTARAKREDRERRAERKKRRAAEKAPDPDERPDLGEPFVADRESG